MREISVQTECSREHRRRGATGVLCLGQLRPAFSFLEMLVVVLVMGILAAVAIPTFHDSLMYNRVESAARRVKADLEQLRQVARRTSRTQQMTFGDSSYALAAEVLGLEQVTDLYTVDLKGSPYDLNSVSIEFGGDATLSFNGHGVPTSSGAFVLQAGKHQRIVTLDSDTGEITITGGKKL